ncbi:hypothetical protein PM023_07455 [Halorubrum ezzemoulense]|uniref:hypothetical protein n=1 Tax=Halorubrum ezzemoulense TaxID=337243 RepID=UPI00232D3A98|nr:hypothetical protein [Halorubrum ezzemoulense]MDB2224504.1 hypothetical protein [Halorubrum ezzemoulense]MDB2273855.1 hypothetical protein [Halorubrum ezzemoulense]MDB9300417.1 hypothetical protein [Halorubrum ezzemoulense]
MNRRGLVVVAAALALFVTGSAVALAGPVSGGPGGLLGGASDPPALLHFDTDEVRCPDDFSANSSTSVVAGAENTEITYSRNVSLPGPSHAIGGPTFERVNESAYVLDVSTEETDAAPRSCSGVVRYNGTVRIPAGDDPWTLIVKQDGETVTTLRGDSDSSLLGGSTSVSGSVSAPDSGSNSTDSSE